MKPPAEVWNTAVRIVDAEDTEVLNQSKEFNQGWHAAMVLLRHRLLDLMVKELERELEK